MQDDVSAGSSARSSVGGREASAAGDSGEASWRIQSSSASLGRGLWEGVVAMEKASLFPCSFAFEGDRGLAWKCVSGGASKSSKTRSSSEIRAAPPRTGVLVDGGSTKPSAVRKSRQHILILLFALASACDSLVGADAKEIGFIPVWREAASRTVGT